ASSARWRWVTLVLLLSTAAIPAVRWREQRMAAARGALAVDAPPAPAATASPTVAAAPTPMDSVTQALQRELADTRRIAIEAQQRADRLEAQRMTTESKPTATAEPAPNVPGPPIPGPSAVPSFAMLRVSTIGASTEIALDGGASGIVGNGWVKLTPGRHQVTATGDLRFTPPTYFVNAAAGDTLWVIFAREGSVPAGVPRQLFIPHNYKWLPAQQRRQFEAFASGELLQRLKGMRAPTRPLSEGRLRP
ncbi:MAG: hypothetical protein K2X99_12865, partial [Gemmatimonadaceae bacterium]|nr:hypothetical protein [Gemmatimonadaceae bacterium]